MAYYVFTRDLQKDRPAPDLSLIEKFCKKVIRKDVAAEKNRKQQEEKNDNTRTATR